MQSTHLGGGTPGYDLLMEGDEVEIRDFFPACCKGADLRKTCWQAPRGWPMQQRRAAGGCRRLRRRRAAVDDEGGGVGPTA